MLAQVLALAAALQAPSAEERSAAAARSLDARAECVPFRWEDDGNGNSRAAMSVAVELNGRTMWFQVDTGADTNILYGSVADAAGWAKATAGTFAQEASGSVGRASIDPTRTCSATCPQRASTARSVSRRSSVA
jgi:hypothetical protein